MGSPEDPHRSETVDDTSTVPATAGKRATIRDVAALAGVSKSLAAAVYVKPESVSPARTKRVHDAAEALGYHPNLVARSLAANTGNFHAILVADLHNPVHADLIDIVRVALSEAGELSLVASAAIAQVDRHPTLDRQTLALLRDLRPKGILVIGSIPNMGVLRDLPGERPVIVVGAIAQNLPHATTVRVDDRAGMRIAVEHLLDHGHQSIAHIGRTGGPVAAGRADAYAEVMHLHGLSEYIAIVDSDYTYDSGYRAMAALIRDRRGSLPSAVTAVNDLAAIGAMAALRDELPADVVRSVAVIGYDNSYLAALSQVQLTSVDSNNALIGSTAIELLLEGSPHNGEEVLVAPSLVIRGSSTDPHDRLRPAPRGRGSAQRDLATGAD
ncbi:transcriptional regulator, LacI family [Microbacterium esteraromaticum]|uniref:Transcriptional regulator, LacI family n=1 Tax=Microbacterium esteraromaticum TaxID=57043 RepID=A0A1R4K0Q2_9MICO|nr:LacI family DNA-binding transcriptional regulator [Microbacterium esteraromaticum]SJN37744.1 transcriptional regulator, LacI family [Microbacterium esteraromaticum]